MGCGSLRGEDYSLVREARRTDAESGAGSGNAHCRILSMIARTHSRHCEPQTVRTALSTASPSFRAAGEANQPSMGRLLHCVRNDGEGVRAGRAGPGNGSRRRTHCRHGEPQAPRHSPSRRTSVLASRRRSNLPFDGCAPGSLPLAMTVRREESVKQKLTRDRYSSHYPLCEPDGRGP